MGVTFEQAREVLAEDLAEQGDGRRVASRGWENDSVFVLAFDARRDHSEPDEDEEELIDGVDGDDDDWGTAEDIAAILRHVREAPAGWDLWEGPAEVPVVEKATGLLRWVIPEPGEPVAPDLRPIGEPPKE